MISTSRGPVVVHHVMTVPMLVVGIFHGHELFCRVFSTLTCLIHDWRSCLGISFCRHGTNILIHHTTKLPEDFCGRSTWTALREGGWGAENGDECDELCVADFYPRCVQTAPAGAQRTNENEMKHRRREPAFVLVDLLTRQKYLLILCGVVVLVDIQRFFIYWFICWSVQRRLQWCSQTTFQAASWHPGALFLYLDGSGDLHKTM